MVKRLAAITFIFICTAIGWFILAGSVMVRTDSADSQMRRAVSRLWGTEQTQMAPQIYERIPYERTVKQDDGTKQIVTEYRTAYHTLAGSDITADIALKHRKKGLLWYSTYGVDFSGLYSVRNPSNERKTFHFDFFLPQAESLYDNFQLHVNGQTIADVQVDGGKVHRKITLEPGQQVPVKVTYSSQGMENWYYDFGQNAVQVKDFNLTVNTDFADIDFPEEGISPTVKTPTDAGWKLQWNYKSLLTGVRIGLAMPQKLNPGPWVAKVTTAAPVSLFLFFFLLFIITVVTQTRIHPMNFFFIGTGFFSFHLLLAYLVDHLSVHAAFAVASLVSLFLVTSYMRLVVGLRKALLQVGLSQLVYLIFFSYTFFFKGYTGLAITILCIATLFIVMQATGKLDWEQAFRQNSDDPGNPGLTPEPEKT